MQEVEEFVLSLFVFLWFQSTSTGSPLLLPNIVTFHSQKFRSVTAEHIFSEKRNENITDAKEQCNLINLTGVFRSILVLV